MAASRSKRWPWDDYDWRAKRTYNSTNMVEQKDSADSVTMLAAEFAAAEIVFSTLIKLHRRLPQLDVHHELWSC